MYNLKIKAKSGADLRAQLLALLGEVQQAPAVPHVEASFTKAEETVLEALAPRSLAEHLAEVDKQIEQKAEEEKPKRIRRTKEQLAAEQAAEKQTVGVDANTEEPEQSEEDEEKPKPTEQPESKKVVTSSSLTEQDLIKTAIGLGTSRKSEVKAILEDEFGVSKIPQLKPEHYAAFMAKLEELEAA